MDTPHTRITELDYDAVLDNLYDMYEGQDYWKDYDFRGSQLNIFLRNIAYVAHQAGFYANMVSSEGSLHTSQIRTSAVSHAKPLSYTPRSRVSSKINGTLSIIGANQPTNITLAKGTTFRAYDEITRGSANSKIFTTVNEYVSNVQEGEAHTFSDVQLAEGQYFSVEYIVNNRDRDQKFHTVTANVDMQLTEVYVQEGTDSSVLSRYVHADSVVELTSDSKVFFYDELSDGSYNIFFGDGVLGKNVSHGNVVRIVYFQTNGNEGNGLETLKLISNDAKNPDLITFNVVFAANAKSAGGLERETIDDIKFNAPRKYTSANRAFSSTDWQTIMQNIFPEIANIKVWGGEDENAPLANFGRVFISLDRNGAPVSERKRVEIIQRLNKDYRIMEVEPIIVPAEYIFVSINASPVYASGNLTTENASLIKLLIIEYSSTRINQFDSRLETSHMASFIHDKIPELSGIYITIEAEIRETPVLNREIPYSVNFRNNITPGSLRTNSFTFQNNRVILKDNSNGIIQMIRSDVANGVVRANIGTVNYNTGLINVSPIGIQRVDNGILSFFTTPDSNHLTTVRNKILRIDPSKIKVA